jgi:regulator of protease activity HflC (stomatin/prohibitin superfamily)
MRTQEIKTSAISGWLMAGVLTLSLAGIIWMTTGIAAAPVLIFPTVVLAALWAFVAAGFFTLQPNLAAVLVLFGKYQGTVVTSGWCWANPLLKKIKVSLRSRNLNGERIKVNDKRGNPIEIALVVVWRVSDTARAVFDVDDYTSFVKVQSEAALRHLASAYPYDTFESDEEQSLRGNMEEVSAALQKELEERVNRAGVEIEEARLSHLAYAPEIAGAMLQRQQADAVVAARSRIVEGAIGMVEMALARLEQGRAVELDDERRAAMVSNLLVVLCGEHAAQPVVNAGTLYT